VEVHGQLQRKDDDLVDELFGKANAISVHFFGAALDTMDKPVYSKAASLAKAKAKDQVQDLDAASSPPRKKRDGEQGRTGVSPAVKKVRIEIRIENVVEVAGQLAHQLNLQSLSCAGNRRATAPPAAVEVQHLTAELGKINTQIASLQKSGIGVKDEDGEDGKISRTGRRSNQKKLDAANDEVKDLKARVKELESEMKLKQNEINRQSTRISTLQGEKGKL